VTFLETFIPICVLLQAPSACVDATTWVRGLHDFLETFISLQSAMAFLSFESIEWVKKTHGFSLL